MGAQDWRRYAAPAAFLLAATIAIVLIRAGIQSGSSPGTNVLPPPATTQKLVVTTQGTTTATSHTPPARRFWTVQAGDTFGVISSKTGVPVATIQQLNPKVSSTSLFIGEKIRLR